jgi:hypothetical protein
MHVLFNSGLDRVEIVDLAEESHRSISQENVRVACQRQDVIPSLPEDGIGPANREPDRKQERDDGAACGFWTRAWGQREPALQGTGRLDSPARSPGRLKGGLDIPTTHAQCHPRPIERPLRTLTRWANWKCSICFTSLAPLRKRAARGSSAHRTRPWPRRRSLEGWSAVFLKPPVRAQHERPGFPTANDHIERPLGRAY